MSKLVCTEYHDQTVERLQAETQALRAKLKRAIELLHMLVRVSRAPSHPDVAAFLAEVGEP